MTGDATFDLYGFMFVDERTSFVRVAFEAHSVLRRSRTDLPAQEASVWVVTVIALHQTLVYAVMERSIELLFGLQMTTVAEQRRPFLHQELAFLGVVG